MFVAPPKEIELTTRLKGGFPVLARVWRLVDQLCDTVGGEGIPMPAEAELR